MFALSVLRAKPTSHITHQQFATFHSTQPRISLGTHCPSDTAHTPSPSHRRRNSARHIMAWRAGFQFVSIACCGSRKCEADKRYEEREIGKMQGMLEHDDSDREMESLDGSRAQDLLLGVEASDNRGLQIEEEGQNDDDLQNDGAIQDDGAVRDLKPKWYC
jgi:hypothetical protein